MKAAVLEARGRLVLKDVEDPTCPPGGLLLETRACTICSTDVKMFEMGQRDLVYPRILGHEISGVVVESEAECLEEGDRVQVFPGVVCGSCPSCRRGAENQCRNIRIFGFSRDGGFAERISIPRESVQNGGVNLLPQGLRFEEAALAEPLACCINAQELSRVGEDDAVLIFGAGPAGCLHAMLASSRGASKIIMVEPLENRVNLARRARPDLIVKSGEEDVREQVMTATDGRGADAIILASRDVPIDDALHYLLAPRGRICLFSGLSEELASPTLDLNAIHYREILMTGSYGCTGAQNRVAVRLISSGLDVGWMITKRIALEEIGRGMRHAQMREGLTAAITEF